MLVVGGAELVVGGCWRSRTCFCWLGEYLVGVGGAEVRFLVVGYLFGVLGAEVVIVSCCRSRSCFCRLLEEQMLFWFVILKIVS